MINLQNFLQGRIKESDLSDTLRLNSHILLQRVNSLLDAFGETRTVNSGYRNVADQMRINPRAPHSKHLTCQAIDLEDESGHLHDFCTANESVLERLELWCEVRQGPWLHVQSVPPLSGHRWFIP